MSLFVCPLDSNEDDAPVRLFSSFSLPAASCCSRSLCIFITSRCHLMQQPRLFAQACNMCTTACVCSVQRRRIEKMTWLMWHWIRWSTLSYCMSRGSLVGQHQLTASINTWSQNVKLKTGLYVTFTHSVVFFSDHAHIQAQIIITFFPSQHPSVWGNAFCILPRV